MQQVRTKEPANSQCYSTKGFTDYRAPNLCGTYHHPSTEYSAGTTVTTTYPLSHPKKARKSAREGSKREMEKKAQVLWTTTECQ